MEDRKHLYYIDVLKCIGLFCLVLAHVSAPEWLEEIRGFDVPLMVFVSGMLSKSSVKKVRNPMGYLWKRIDRLLIPTWIFLVGFYICMTAVGQLPSAGIIIKSFLLQRDSGIAGYVWIIWVYILCAIITPFVIKVKDKQFFWLALIIVAFIYELIAAYTQLSQIRLLYYTVFTVVPFGIILSLGIKYFDLNKKQRVAIGIVALVLHVAYTIYLLNTVGEYVFIGEYKYPARLYYYSFALPVIVLLIEVLSNLESSFRRVTFVSYVSKHSLWIYLWHIFGLAINNYMLKIENWILSYVFVLLLSLILTWLQNQLFGWLEKKKPLSIYKYFVC